MATTLGFVLTDAHGRVLVRRYGWRLDRSGYRSPFPLLLRRRPHEYAFDPAGPRLLPVAPGGDADLGGGYRLIYHQHHRWSVLAPDSREIWTIPGANVTVSADA